MITHLRGRLIEKSPTHAVIECNGVGYQAQITLSTYEKLPSDEAVFLYTHLQVREDAHTLYGFADATERAFFRLLISVSGVGASTAQVVLSSMSPAELQQALVTENVAAMQAIKGIGAKTAQRIIIDLKGKAATLEVDGEISLPTSNTARDEALTALDVLGFPKAKSQKVVDALLKKDPDLSVEVLIKQALNNI